MLVLTTHVFSQFEERKLGGLQINALWRHSLAVAAMAKGIARAEQAPPKSIDHAFMAGMLHDVGKLILAANIPDPYHAALAMAKQKAMPPQDAERMFLGATHAEVGAYLLGLWGLPDSIVIATALHHRPRAQAENSFSPLIAVHAANALEHGLRDTEEDSLSCAVDQEYLSDLRLLDRVPYWQEICRDIAQKEGTS
jgi:HD-like signal output (HDOD) protein